MKQKISWHEECLKNRAIFYANKRAAAERELAECVCGEAEIVFYQRRIDTEKARGVDAFDRDKPLKHNAGDEQRRAKD